MTNTELPEAKEGDFRMNAYYYSFQHTGIQAIDRILSAVACAGKAYHHTECWDETIERPYEPFLRGHSCVEWIQNAANDAADQLRAYGQACRHEVSEAMVEKAGADAVDFDVIDRLLDEHGCGCRPTDRDSLDCADQRDKLKAYRLARADFTKAERLLILDFQESVRVNQPALRLTAGDVVLMNGILYKLGAGVVAALEGP